MKEQELKDKIETLIDTVEGTIRNGGVSNDTRLIVQSILLNALIIYQAAEKINSSLSDIDFHLS